MRRMRSRGTIVTRVILTLLSIFVVDVTVDPVHGERVGERRVFDFEHDLGGIPFDDAFDACAHNSDTLSRALRYNVSGGNTLRFSADTTFHFHHGIVSSRLRDCRIEVNGVLRFERAELSIDARNPFPACWTIARSRNVTITSSLPNDNDRGIIDGQGSQWWGYPFIGYLQTVENRPRLLRFNLTDHILIERIVLQDSPYHTLYLDAVRDVVIRHVSIVARRTTLPGHSWVDLTAFNTDGIDVSGTRVHVHDVDIWVQDDCIAIKDGHNHSRDSGGDDDDGDYDGDYDDDDDDYDANNTTSYESAHMLFERINATGLGFVVGSIQGTHVHNITFQNSYLFKPVKGIYMKFANRHRRFRQANMSALVEDVRYINITMVSPQQWPIWLGPAQQSDNRNPCHPNPCSLCWPMTPGSVCHTVPRQIMRNITLQNIIIHNPVMSTGVLMGNAQYPIEHVTFDNVRVTKGLPPAITRRPLNETFPGTMRPVHDPFVPPDYANKMQRQLVGIYGWFAHIIRTVGQFVQDLIERIHVTVLLRLLQTQDGAQAWYFSYLAQALLDTVWIWIVCALGFTIAGVFSFRGWMKYRRRRVVPMDAVGEGAEEELLLRHPRVETRWPPWLCHLGFLTLLCICWGGALYTGTFPFLKPKWERTYRYFTCENIVNGTAKGNTWPVPYCFKRERPPWWPDGEDDDDNNQDHRHHRRGHGSGHWTPRKVETNVELTVLAKTLAAFAAAMLLMWRRNRRGWRTLRSDTTQQQAAPDRTSELASSSIPSFVTVQANPDGEENEEESRLLPLDEATHNQLVAHRSGSVDFIDPLEAPAFHTRDEIH